VRGQLLKADDEEEAIPLIERMRTMVKWWCAGTLSKGTPYEFERLARTMEGVLDIEALQAEAVRILKRKRESESQKELAKEVISTIEQWLQAVPLSGLAQEMIIAAEIANAKEMAKSNQDAEKGTP